MPHIIFATHACAKIYAYGLQSSLITNMLKPYIYIYITLKAHNYQYTQIMNTGPSAQQHTRSPPKHHRHDPLVVSLPNVEAGTCMVHVYPAKPLREAVQQQYLYTSPTNNMDILFPLNVVVVAMQNSKCTKYLSCIQLNM